MASPSDDRETVEERPDVDPWHTRRRVVPVHSERFPELVTDARELYDRITGSNPPDDAVDAAIAHLRAANELLRPYEVPEFDAPAGKLDFADGRGQPLLLPLQFEVMTTDDVRARVRFPRAYLGGNTAAHGGTLPLLFDEVLGHLSNSGARPVARTAYLHVNYRKITPIDTDLVIEAHLEREEGRKRWVSGRLLHGDTLLSDAEGLFVVLLPGQP
jgi:acyl-coenzyme A thioesterase PaaI-like protein